MSRLSTHAQQRAAQRAIPALLLCLLDQFGTRRRVPGGVVRYFDAATRDHLRHALKDLLGRWDALGQAYAVLDPEADKVITVAHRTRRWRRP